MKKITYIIFMLFNCWFAIAQNPAPQDLLPLDPEKFEMIKMLHIEDSKENLSKITVVELLQYLITPDSSKNSDSIIPFKYFIPKDFVSRKDVEFLIQYVNSKQEAKKIHHHYASMATPKKSSLGYEAMHLISLYRFEKFNYPSLCYLCNNKEQNILAKEFMNWWKSY